MNDATALSYHHLLEYHAACARAVCTEFEKASDEWVAAITPIAKDRASHKDAIPRGAISWMKDRLDDAREAIENDTKGPSADVATAFSIHSLLSTPEHQHIWPSGSWKACSALTGEIAKVETRLQPGITEAIRGVSFCDCHSQCPRRSRCAHTMVRLFSLYNDGASLADIRPKAQGGLTNICCCSNTI